MPISLHARPHARLALRQGGLPMDLVLESPSAGIEVWPRVLRSTERVVIAFRAARVVGAMSLPRYRVTVLNERRRHIATLLRGPARPSQGVVCVEWDGRDEWGAQVPSGTYRIRVAGAPPSSLLLERTLPVEI